LQEKQDALKGYASSFIKKTSINPKSGKRGTNNPQI
jgi:hypothetical protein